MPISNYLPDYNSPSAVVQKILQQRRDEARQALIDKLSADNMTAEQEARNRQLDISQQHANIAETAEKRAGEAEKAEQEVRRAQIAASNAQREGALVESAPYAGGKNAIPEDSELFDVLRSRGYMEQLGPMQGPTEDGTSLGELPGGGPSNYYLGSQEFQKEADVMNRWADLPENPTPADILARGGQVPSDMLRGTTKARVFDEATGKWSEGPEMPYGTSVIERQRPYNQPASISDIGMAIVQGPDGSTRTIWGTDAELRNKLTAAEKEGFQVVRIGNPPANQSQTQMIPSQGEMQAFLEAKQKYADAFGWGGGSPETFWPALVSAGMNIGRNMGLNERALYELGRLLNDPESANVDSDLLLGPLVEDKILTQEDYYKALNVMQSIRDR